MQHCPFTSLSIQYTITLFAFTPHTHTRIYKAKKKKAKKQKRACLTPPSLLSPQQLHTHTQTHNYAPSILAVASLTTFLQSVLSTIVV